MILPSISPIAVGKSAFLSLESDARIVLDEREGLSADLVSVLAAGPVGALPLEIGSRQRPVGDQIAVP